MQDSCPSHLQGNHLISCLFFLENKVLNHSSKELKGIAVVKTTGKMLLILTNLGSELHMDLPQLVYTHCTVHYRQCTLLSDLFLALEKKDEGIGIDLHVKPW